MFFLGGGRPGSEAIEGSSFTTVAFAKRLLFGYPATRNRPGLRGLGALKYPCQMAF